MARRAKPKEPTGPGVDDARASTPAAPLPPSPEVRDAFERVLPIAERDADERLDELRERVRIELAAGHRVRLV